MSPHPQKIAIVLATVAALLITAWFALGARESHELNTVTAMLARSQRLDAAQARRANDLLNSAGTLNPDRQVQLLRGAVALAAGRTGEAQRLIMRVARAEPMNAAAWGWLARAAVNNHQLILLALGNIARLVDKPVR